jgi:RNA polymerase sigma factor (sigma-70 family)
LRDPSKTTLATYWTQVGRLERATAESAWRWFIGRYRGFVLDVLRRSLGADAAPAADDFWGYLFTSGALERADRTRRLRPFLVGVLRNFGRDWRRRNRPSAPDQASFEPTTADSYEDEELALWATSVLRNALDEMRHRWPSSAEVLALFYGLDGSDGVAVTEIAGKLACNANAVHQALHRGRARLRRCLELELLDLVGDAQVTSEIELILGVLGRRSPGLIDG